MPPQQFVRGGSYAKVLYNFDGQIFNYQSELTSQKGIVPSPFSLPLLPFHFPFLTSPPSHLFTSAN